MHRKKFYYRFLAGSNRLRHMRRAIARARLYTRLKHRRTKIARLVSFKKLQGVRQIALLKQCFLSFTFYITQRSYEKIMCIYFLFHWFSGENCIIFLFSLHKERQTSKELKRNMNDGTIVFTYRLNLKNSSSLFFLIQDNFMF